MAVQAVSATVHVGEDSVYVEYKAVGVGNVRVCVPVML
jgi:hypothetical protein